MAIDTHKVEIVPITLEPHPDADRLSLVKVYNFTCVVNTADWLGVTTAAYVQPDSVMPDTPEYRFLKETGNIKKERADLEAKLAAEPESDLARIAYNDGIAALEAKIDKNTKRLRITVQKFRGVLSMGMLLPIPKCQLCLDDAVGETFAGAPTLNGKYHELGTEFQTICMDRVEIGDDVAVAFGITHYEPPSMDEVEGRRKHTGDDVASPPSMIYAPKYDVESVYKYATCFDPGELVYVTEKLDGQNARFVWVPDVMPGYDVLVLNGQDAEIHTITPAESIGGQLHCGSRTEWKKQEGGSNWWRVLDTNPWIVDWCRANPGKVLYGEIFGWVQSLKYGAKQGQLFFRAFDIIDGMEYLDVEQFLASVPEDRRVPSFGIMPFDFEALQKLADGQSTVPNAANIREGIVVKPVKERKHYKLGRVMVKMVSNAYLEKSAR